MYACRWVSIHDELYDADRSANRCAKRKRRGVKLVFGECWRIFTVSGAGPGSHSGAGIVHQSVRTGRESFAWRALRQNGPRRLHRFSFGLELVLVSLCSLDQQTLGDEVGDGLSICMSVFVRPEHLARSSLRGISLPWNPSG